MRVVGKEGALGGGRMKATSWMAKKIMTCYQLRRSVYYYGVWPISIVGGAFEQKGGVYYNRS